MSDSIPSFTFQGQDQCACENTNGYSNNEGNNIMPVKPSSKEEEYFSRIDLEKRKAIEEEKHRLIADEEKKQLKKLHYMRCPKCGMELSEIDHKGITVDKCFSCDGIWLDAGELESVAKLETGAMNKLFNVFKK